MELAAVRIQAENLSANYGLFVDSPTTSGCASIPKIGIPIPIFGIPCASKVLGLSTKVQRDGLASELERMPKHEIATESIQLKRPRCASLIARIVHHVSTSLVFENKVWRQKVWPSWTRSAHSLVQNPLSDFPLVSASVPCKSK